MRSRHLFVEEDFGRISLSEQVERFMTRAFDPAERRALDKDYLIRNAIDAMTATFHNRAASRTYLHRALALDASDWVVWANIATVSWLDGRAEDGKREHLKAASLRGEPIDPDDRGTPYLREALDRSAVDVAGVR